MDFLEFELKRDVELWSMGKVWYIADFSYSRSFNSGVCVSLIVLMWVVRN